MDLSTLGLTFSEERTILSILNRHNLSSKDLVSNIFSKDVFSGEYSPNPEKDLGPLDLKRAKSISECSDDSETSCGMPDILKDSSDDFVEPILRDNSNRYVLFPIEHQDLWDHYKKMVQCFWVPEEIKFNKDQEDWKKLSNDERHFIKTVLAFFAGSDGIVMENLAERFMKDIQIPEARQCYGYQIMIEGIHSETYSLLIDSYVKDPKEKSRLFNAMNAIPCVSKKAQWAIRWINDKKSSFALRLIGFAAVEGIFFSGSFCSIFWLKQRGLMPGLAKSNELISRDEGQHTDLAILLLNMLVKKPKESVVHELIKDAVAIEKEFVCDALPCELIGMNSTLMSQYIEFVADRLLVQMGYKKIWKTENPFDWMELISMPPKTNFFEKEAVQYNKASVGRSEEDNSLSFDSIF